MAKVMVVVCSCCEILDGDGNGCCCSCCEILDGDGNGCCCSCCEILDGGALIANCSRDIGVEIF